MIAVQRALQPVGAVAIGIPIASGRFDQTQALPRGHPPQSVLSDPVHVTHHRCDPLTRRRVDTPSDAATDAPSDTRRDAGMMQQRSPCRQDEETRQVARGSPRRERGDPLVGDQWMVNCAEAATSYGVVLFLSNCTTYVPGSTVGGAEASMSPCVSASVETGNRTSTVLDWPASSATRVNPTNRCGGTTTLLTGWATYTGTMSTPPRVPLLVTVKVAVAVPVAATFGVTERLLVAKVV